MAGTPVFDITPPALAPTSNADALSSHRASRSKFKSFFVRRKPSPSPDANSTTSNNDDDESLALAIQFERQHLIVPSKPLLSMRTQSDTAVPQASSLGAKERHLPRGSSRMSSTSNTKTFLYAYSKAYLRSTVRTIIKSAGTKPIPVSSNSSEEVASGSLRYSHGNRTDGADDEEQTHPSSLTVDKLFVLADKAEILQYSTNGDPDRLPERVFPLTHESLAFPSDAFPGKGMALEVTSRIDASEQIRPKTNRSTWARNPFRSSTMKRSTDSLIMIFDDVELMSTWLTTIRKEIDGFGPPSSRPTSAWAGTDKALPSLRNASTERFSLRQSFLHLSRSSSSLRHEFSEALNAKDQALLPVPPPPVQQRNSPRSRAASSINTTTSLDRLRESDSHSTTTGTTNSLDGSVVLDSPVKETFASIAGTPSSIDTRATTFAEAFTQKPVPPTLQTLRERRKPSVNQLRLPNTLHPATNETKRTEDLEKELPNLVATKEEGKNTTDDTTKARPVSVLAPLPSPDDIKKPAKLLRTQSTDAVVTLEHPKIVRPASSHEGHRSKLSTDTTNKSMYSLFPKKRVEAPKSEPLVVPEANHIPGLSVNQATDHLTLPPTPTVAITPAVSPASTRNSSRKPSPIKLLAAIEMEQPMRSPAVTDDMLASNFGTYGYKVPPSPISPSNINVPTFDDLKFDFSFLKDDFIKSGRRRSNSPSAERGEGGIRRLKSTPSLRLSRAPTAPLGPPPTGPLPAVPPEEATMSNPASPQARTSGEERKSNRSESKSPPSSFRQKSPTQSLTNTFVSSRSSSAPQPETSTQTHSPLALVGMPSIISPPPVPTTSHIRQKSGNKGSNPIKTHKRAKSSGKFSLSMNVKSFPPTPVLCDKPGSYYC